MAAARSSANFILVLLYRVDVGNVADVSESHVDSMLALLPRRWKQHVSPNRQQHRPHSHGVTTEEQS
jgi:hypothetical protein